MIEVVFNDALKKEYQGLYDSAVVSIPAYGEHPDRFGMNVMISQIRTNKPRYLKAAAPIGCPWYLVACLHAMESSLRFDCHLLNGDPLTARTVHEPPGRIPGVNPPYTWEQGADDALRLKGFDKIKTWDIPTILFELESYNGLGYREWHPTVLSPYLWSKTNKYKIGKYRSDGKFDPNLVSQQIGCVPILKGLGV